MNDLALSEARIKQEKVKFKIKLISCKAAPSNTFKNLRKFLAYQRRRFQLDFGLSAVVIMSLIDLVNPGLWSVVRLTTIKAWEADLQGQNHEKLYFDGGM